MELDGKVAIITGSAQGQGASHARCLAANGATVLVTDILDQKGAEVVEEIVARGGSGRYQHLDVRSGEDWADAITLAEEEFGRLDILVNNAGVPARSGVDECTDAEWDEAVAVNQTGPFKGIRAALPSMRKVGGGSIINISSVYGLRGVWGYAGYVSSKAALVGLTRSAAIQLGHENIRVNVICPSAVQTPMLEDELSTFADNPDFDWERWLAEKPIPRVADPEEISEMVLYLASARSSFVTGSIFTLDGGYTA